MKLILASNNKHKAIEVKSKLADLDIEILTLKDIGLEIEIVEDSETLEGNAKLKSHKIFEITQQPVIADDTGLMVDLLNGAPGVYSARYAGEGCTYEENNNKLLKELSKFDKPYIAQFVSVISLKSKFYDELFIGTCEGQIIQEKKGTNGFGYDPIFLPNGFTKTYAELTLEEKNLISHRAKSLEKLKLFLKNNRLS